MINCLVVDDEPLARDLLSDYIKDTPRLRQAASCSSALEALEVMKSEQIDLLFLDVNMPRLDGISMLKSLRVKPVVVLTTAYAEYALEGYDLEVCDYLLKPFSFERFLKAVGRVESYLFPVGESGSSGERLVVKSDKRTWSLELASVQCIEGSGDYVTIHSTDRRILVHDTLKSMESELPSASFCRIHKTWIVNRGYIDFLEGNRVFMTNGREIPVGKTYKETLETWLR